MSIIAAGTTTTTALTQTGNTDGTLQLQVNGTTPSVTLNALGAVGVGSTPGYGTSGQILTSSGSTSAPAWANPAAVNLTTGVTGTLPIANGGTNSTATPTAGGIGYGTGTAHAYTTAGTTGQVLTSAGASAPTWSTLTGSPFVLVSTVTASNSSYVTFDSSVVTSAYDEYVVQFVGYSSGSYADLYYQLYGGGAWVTAGYNFWTDLGSTKYNQDNASYVMFDGTGQGSGQSYLATANTYMLEVRLFRVNDTANTQNKLCLHTGGFSIGGNYAVQFDGGAYNVNMKGQAVRGIRFYTSSPTMTGFARLFGVKSS